MDKVDTCYSSNTFKIITRFVKGLWVEFHYFCIPIYGMYYGQSGNDCANSIDYKHFKYADYCFNEIS